MSEAPHSAPREGESDLEKHLRALSEGDEDTRNEACFDLGKSADPRAITPLLEQLRSGRVSSTFAIQAIGQIGHLRSVGVLRNLARSEEYRFECVKALIGLAKEAAHPDLAWHLQWDPERREACDAALACLMRLMHRTPDAIVDFLTIQDQLSTDTQREAMLAILLRMNTAAASVLVPLLRRNERSLRRVVAEALSAVAWIPTNSTEGVAYWAAVGSWDACELMGTIAVGPLIAALHETDIDRETRKSIIRALGHLGDYRALPAVRAQLRDGEVRESVAEALGHLGDGSDVGLLRSLSTDAATESERRAAFLSLVHLGDSTAIARLPSFLSECPWPLRQSVEKALVDSSAETIRALRHLLQSDDPAAIRVAAHSLGTLHDSKSVRTLTALLEHPDGSVVASAALALGHMGDLNAVEPLSRVVAVAHDPVETGDSVAGISMDDWFERYSPQSSAAWALGELGDISAVASIVAAWTAAPPFARQAMAVALAKLDPGTASNLLGLGSTEGFAWRDLGEGLARELWRLGELAVEPLAAALHHSLRRDGIVPSVSQQSLVISLGRTRHVSAIDPLLKALQKCDRHQRRDIFAALVEIGPQVVPELLKLMSGSADADIRQDAIRALTALQANAPLEPGLRAAALERLTSFGRRDGPFLMHCVVQALGTFREPQAVPFLVDILRAWDEPVNDRKARILALRRAKRPLSQVLHYWESEWKNDEAVGRTRFEAACALAELGVADGAALLVTALGDPNSEVRQRSVRALARCVRSDSVEPLTARTVDWHPDVRRAAVESLGGLRRSEGLPALRRALTDENHEVRQAAALALDNLAWRPNTRRQQSEFWIAKQDWNRCAAVGDSAVAALSARVADAVPPIRHAAIQALAACRGLKAADALRALLRKGVHDNVRVAAITAIADQRRIELSGEILECLRNERHANVAAAAIQALKRLRVRPPVDILREVLHTSDAALASVAASMLGDSNDPDAIPLLTQVIERAPDVVRHSAIQALGRLRAGGAVASLRSRLESDGADHDDRVLAAEALGEISGPVAFSVLLETVRQRPELRRAAEYGLELCASERALGPFLWELHIERDQDNAHPVLRSALSTFAEVPLDDTRETAETVLGALVQAAAERRLREGSRGAALACYANALRFYTQRLDSLEDANTFWRGAEFAFRLATAGVEFFAERKDPRAAAEIGRCAIELATTAGNYKTVWDAMCAVCAALTRAGDDRLALEVHESAIRLIESMWFFHPTEEVRLRAFFADKAALYDGLALCYQRLGATAQAWETLEAAKTRYLSDLIVRRNAAPLETYSQVQDVRWAPVRRASAAAEGASDAAAAGRRQLAGIEPAGTDEGPWVLEPERRKALAEFLLTDGASRWRMSFIDTLWDAAPEWVGTPSGFRLRQAFTPLRLSIQDAVLRRRGEPGAIPSELRRMIETTREALAEVDFTHKERVLALGSDYFPGLTAFVEAAPPYTTAETLELEALLEVLSVICGEGEVFVTSRPRTANDPPAKWRGVFQEARPQSRARRLHEASQRLDAAWQSVAEPNWRYVTHLARGEPSSFSRLRAMLGYESAHAIVAFHVTARGTVVYLFRGALREGDQLPPSDSSRFQTSDTLTFPALTLARVQALVGAGWLDPLQTLELHTNNERIEEPERLRMTDTLGQLYTDLLGPVVQRLRRWRIRRITFIPSRGLYALPLHASWYPSGGDKRYLAEDYDIAYAPSVTLLDICRTRCENRVPFPVRLYSRAGSSSDLPFARTEVARVARLFPTSSLPTFAETHRADTATHIHFACHGDYNWDDPLESGLQLAEDQRLRLADLFNDAFPLKNASLVVLSACQTGVADPSDLADEYLGLTAGFLFAGAPAVISTLWPVNDLATMLLMEQLYRHQLNRKRGAAAALRHAQRSLRNVSAESVRRRLTTELAKLPAAEKGSTQEEILQSALLSFSDMEPNRRPFDHPYWWAAFTMNGLFETA